MKVSILSACALAVLLWTGAQAMGQGRGQGKGKEHQQQLQAVDKQLRHTQAKQLERQARLARIRELAVQKGDNEMVARVDKLIAKQNEVFSRRQMHLQTQKRAAEQPQMQGQQAPVTPPAQPPAQGETAKPAEVNKPTK
ncbi:MAG: hypothetical protein ABFE01_22795 [Phycisphaerales bacterium]